MKKRIFTIIIIGLLLFPASFINAADTVSVSIDGTQVVFNQTTGYPFIDANNRTQVPFRVVLEAFGAAVDWDSATRTAIAEKDGITVKVPIGTDYIYKDGIKIANDTTSLIKDSRTYLPIRIVLEAFGATVNWDGTSKTVIVQTGQAGQSGTPVVKIGIFEPQTGDNGAGGKKEILGMQYANVVTPTVDIAGRAYKVELFYTDNQSDVSIAPKAAELLVDSGCSIVLGSYGSGVSIAASDTFAEAGMPVIGASCTNPWVTAGNSHYFRICFLDPFQGTVMSHFAKDEFKAKKAYCLAKLGDDYSGGLCNFFMEAFGDANCYYETFPDGTNDYSAYVAKAKAYGADVFFSPVSTEAAVRIIDQAAAQELKIPILAGDTWDSYVVLDAAKGKDVNVYVTAFYQEGGTPAFDSGFKTWINSNAAAKANNGGGSEIAAVSAMGYDAYHTALEALKKAGSTDPAKVLSVLGSVKYSGVTGSGTFDSQGDAVRDSAFIKKCNTKTGEWEFTKQQKVD